MPLIKLYKSLNEVPALEKKRIYDVYENIISIQKETCFYIETTENVGEWHTIHDLEIRLGGSIICMLGDPWLEGADLNKNSTLVPSIVKNTVFLEIGPRLNFTTSWSTNAVSICKAAGITSIVRLEHSRRFLIEVDCPLTKSIREKFLAMLHDPMTEQEYEAPLDSFTLKISPEPWTQVDVIGQGKESLEKVNKNMGLAFDDWDLDYYTDLFQNKVKRNPTTVELFDLAQSNSEHSRHWFFKGDYVADGEKLPQSLLDMVMCTNDPQTTNQNNVISFSDNSSGIKGWTTPTLTVSDPTMASSYEIKPLERDLIFTAETHNFPTGVAPFSGATTGTGGRIRDVQAVGRGGHVVAGTAGYCFGNLNIPGYKLPWEDDAPAAYPGNFASPLEVAIEASNGASDYGNKFGEPLISGFARSFGCVIGESLLIERREWIKPIMFSGGMGTLDHDMITKLPPRRGYLILKIGGPAYRIGVGGGAASSIEVQGDNSIQRDLGAVQRGDAEMEQKMNRVIRGCLEQRPNPILSIHDQGAGGNANVLKEMMEGSGGAVYSESITAGDPTLSTLEKWGAEYQESNAVLIEKNQLQNIEQLAERERCPIDVVGVITDDQKIRLIEESLDVNTVNINTVDVVEDPAQMNPVDLHLEHVLGKMPKKEFSWSKERIQGLPIKLPVPLTVQDATERVLRLPAVASKRYLTNKVDRSVTGLVAQQQCVGPLHTPLADVAVTAHSFFDTKGTATSIGEQPIKILVNPAAGARMTVLEAIANLAAAPITDIKDVKCSANWMWPAKLPGEGWALYKACESMCQIMKSLGIAVDGGKDSLSMAARINNIDGSCTVVKAPGSLVVSAYAPCPDITKVVTPDLKGPSRHVQSGLLWVRPVTAHARLGGTAFAQVFSQVGRNCPDVDECELQAFSAAFTTIQELINVGDVMSLHDISDGGLITCLLEMGLGGLSGFTIELPKPPKPLARYEDENPLLLSLLFSEEVGWVMEVPLEKVKGVVNLFQTRGVVGTCSIGYTTTVGNASKMSISVDGVEVINYSVLEVTRIWEETSFKLEKLQMNPVCAEFEYSSFSKRKHTEYNVPFTYRDFTIGRDEKLLTTVRVAVVREEGTNGDRELAAALIAAGCTVYDVTMTDILTERTNLEDFRGLLFPGGFSFADVLGSGVGWAASILQQKKLRQRFEIWKAHKNTFSLAVCNGCQLLALLGWLNPDETSRAPLLRLERNVSGRFESRWSRIRIESSRSVLLKGMEGANLGVWVAHGEGRFVYKTDEVFNKLQNTYCMAMKYVDDDGNPTEEYPMNPNGSKGGVAGVTSPCGRHLAIMPHPERCFLRWQWPYLTKPLLEPPYNSLQASPWSRMFQNAFDWASQFK